MSGTVRTDWADDEYVYGADMNVLSQKALDAASAAASAGTAAASASTAAASASTAAASASTAAATAGTAAAAASAAATAVGTAATAALNTQTVTDIPRILRPTTHAATKFPTGSRLLTAFQSGHGWTLGVTSGSGTVTDDTSVFADGSQSLKITTPASNYTFASSPVQSPTLDLTKNSIVIKFRADVILRSNGVQLLATDGAAANMGTTRATTGQFNNASALVSDDGEWIWMSVNPGDWAVAPGFTLPNMAAITRLGVFAAANSVGTVNVNVQQIALRPAPTAAGTIIGFDDGYSSQWSIAKPYMDKYNFKGCLFLIRDLVTGSSQYMSVANVQAMYDSGWDVCAHANTGAAHNSANALLDSSITDGTATALSSFESELALNKEWLLDNGWRRGADFFAWPQGKFNAARVAIARKYFALIRTYRPTQFLAQADTYPWPDPAHLGQIGVQSGVSSPTDPAVVIAALDAMWAAGKTVLLTFHGLGSVQSYEYPVASFNAIMDHINSAGYPVKTLSEVMRDNGLDSPVGKNALNAKADKPTGTPDGTKFYADDGTLKSPPSTSLPAQTGHAGQVLGTDGTSPGWVPSGSGGVAAQLFTTTGTYTAPATGLYRISAVGGGGGGSGGGAAALTGGVATQVGAAGSGSGEFVETVAALNSGDTLTCTPGAGGALGAGGAASAGATGNAGVAGGTGTSSTVTGAATLTARGGSPGGAGGANSTTLANPGAPGSGGTTAYPGGIGVGGSATTGGGFQGGAGVGLAAKAGGGGAPASSTLGGFGSSGAFTSSHTGTTAGGNAGAVSGYGAGGNGGGGGAPGGAGGSGVAGGAGVVLVTRIS